MSLLKVCGITRLEDALGCEQVGVWALGFIQVADSPRYCPPDRARNLVKQLDGRVLTVGVFQDMSADIVNRTSTWCGFDLVQLHGSETPQVCQSVELPVIKAFSIDDQWSQEKAEQYRESVTYFLFDTNRNGKSGGTGHLFRWDLVLPLEQFSRPVIIAGGLGMKTIPTLLECCVPYALDCNSQVEQSPGCKDLVAIQHVYRLISKKNEKYNTEDDGCSTTNQYRKGFQQNG